MTKLFVLPLLAGASVFAQNGFIAQKLPDHIKLESPKPAPQVRVEKGNARCAHMIVYKAPDVDPKMVIGGPGAKRQTRMPVIPGMDVCPEDVRELAKKPEAAQKDPPAPER